MRQGALGNPMRALFLVPLILLAGCDALTHQNGDTFQAGPAPSRFEAATQGCKQVADDYVAYDLKGMDGTSYDRNRSFNALFARCMTRQGYAQQSYAKNWLPGG